MRMHRENEIVHPPPRSGGRGTARSAVEGAQAVKNILQHQKKRRVLRPSHRTLCGPRSPLARGGMQKN